MNKLRKYFNSLNLQNKLRLCFIFLILIPSVIIGVAYYGVSYHSIIDIAKKNILDVVVKKYAADRSSDELYPGQRRKFKCGSGAVPPAQ